MIPIVVELDAHDAALHAGGQGLAVSGFSVAMAAGCRGSLF
jgi:hypothetical protein